MSSELERLIKIEALVSASHPALLQGLDVWLNLGLISDTQVKHWCRQNLSCPLPLPKIAPARETRVPVAATRQRVAPQKDFIDDFIPEVVPLKPRRPPSIVAQMWQSLLAELSVRWLLFLGIFLVVMSSGVLAASQWERFPAVGQYGILLAYTVIFWLTGVWAHRQANLQLTAQTLQIVTLLLVPVNFWAMDSFKLREYPVEWLVIAIASTILTAVAARIFPSLSLVPSLQIRRWQSFPFYQFIGLSYLQLLWSLSGFPLLVVYLGMVTTTAITVYPIFHPSPDSIAPTEGETTKVSLLSASLVYRLVAIYILAMLLLRAIFVTGVASPELGLAIGICGWLIAQVETPPTTPNDKPRFSWEKLGDSLIFCGWLVAVGVAFPWQATIVSGIGLWIWYQRLGRRGRKIDFTILVILGWQTIGLVWRLIPVDIRTSAVGMVAASPLINAINTPWMLLGVVLFPYLIGIVWLTARLYRHQKPHLALYGEKLALGFGIILTSVTLSNRNLFALNLILSTTLLGVTLFQQSRRAELADTLPPRVYLTHITGLMALSATIYACFPQFHAETWTIILLAVLVAEWGLTLMPQNSPLFVCWQNSAWHLGLGLAALSYYILYLVNFPHYYPHAGWWGLTWIVVPLSLTFIARQTSPPRRLTSSWLSTIAVIALQLLLIWQSEVRLIALGAGVLLMLANSRYCQHLAAATLTIALGISFYGFCLYDNRVFGLSNLESGWFLVTAIASTILWLFRGWFITRNGTLAALYAQAADGWAVLLVSLNLPILIIYSQADTSPQNPLAVEFLITSILLMAATAYRGWQSPRQRENIWLSILVLALAQIPLLPMPGAREIGLGVATGLMMLHTRYLQQINAARLTIGTILALMAVFLGDGIPGLPKLSIGSWLIVIPIVTLTLWLLRPWLKRRQTNLASVYSQAADEWAINLSRLELVILTLHSFSVYRAISPPDVIVLAATALTIVGSAYRSWQQPDNWAFYRFGWGIEILTAETLSFFNHSTLNLAIANVGLGIFAQIMASVWRRKHNLAQVPSSWHALPMIYAGLGVLFRSNIFTAWTGLSSFAVSAISISVGKQKPEFKPLTYLGIFGISVSAYELLLYQLSQAPPGGKIGDGLLALAALGTSITYAYRLLLPWWQKLFGLTEAELKIVSHIHWGWSAVLWVLAMATFSNSTIFLALGIGVFLARYAIFQGRNHPQRQTAENWVYAGLLTLVGCSFYSSQLDRAAETLKIVNPFIGALAVAIAYFLYFLPWQNWGWPSRPWQQVGFSLPLGAIFYTFFQANLFSFFITAAFYVLIARLTKQIRLTYISAALINLALYRWLDPFIFNNLLWYILPIGLTIIYIAQVDGATTGGLPLLTPKQKETRHQLRLFGSGLICGMAFLLHLQTGIIPGIFALIAIFTGLSLRIRAFLSVGTVTLIAIAGYQSTVLIFSYPLIKWFAILMAGIGLIWLAASFETRKSQLSSLVRNWLEQFQQWD